MKAKKLRLLLDERAPRKIWVNEAEGGIGGITGEEKMQSNESGAGWRLAITAHFIPREERGKLYEGTKKNPCTSSQQRAEKFKNRTVCKMRKERGTRRR